MRRAGLLSIALAAGVVASGCTRTIVVGVPPAGPPDRTVAAGEHGKKQKGPRKMKVPPGHYPPPGQCRLWFAGRPPGKQPPPMPCGRLRGQAAGSGAFILYNGSAWDADYDWRSEARRRKVSVPQIIIDLTIPIGGGRR